MEAVGLAASVITLAGVASTTINGLVLLEEIRETQSDYRLLRHDIESIEAAAKFAERKGSFVSHPQSFEDQYTHQQLSRVRVSLQSIVDEMKEIQKKCARDQNDDKFEARKRSWIRYKSKLSNLRLRGQQVKTDLIFIYQCDSSNKLAAVTRSLDMPAYSPADIMMYLETLLSARGLQLTIAPNEMQAQTATTGGIEMSTVTQDNTDNSSKDQDRTQSPVLDNDKQNFSLTEDQDAELIATFRAKAKLACSKSCRCRCHGKLQLFQRSVRTKSLLGSWNIGYYKSTSVPAPDVVRCRCGGMSPWWVEFEPPWMLWSKALQISVSSNAAVGMHFTLRPVRVLLEDNVVWTMVWSSVHNVKVLIQAGIVCYPDDRMPCGIGLLEYIIAYDNYEIVDLLLALWRGLLTRGLPRRARYMAHWKLMSLGQSTNVKERHVLRKLANYVGVDELETELSRLQEAARYGHGVEEALREGVGSTDALDGLDDAGLAPLHYAAYRGDVEAVHLMVDAKADVNARGGFQQTPLMLATSNNHVECMKVLILAKCRINETGLDGRTALHFAAYDANADAMRLLLRQGARASARDDFGQTPLHCLIYRRYTTLAPSEESVNILLQTGDIDIDARDNMGRTATASALVHNNFPLLRHLVSAGASLSSLDMRSRSLLHYVAAFADPETLLFLHSQELSGFSASVDLELANSEGQTVWDKFVSCVLTPSISPHEHVGHRQPSHQEMTVFIHLYQGIRDRNLQHAKLILERALEVLAKGDNQQAADLVAGLARLKAKCHNHSAAAYYRGMQKEIRIYGRGAMAMIEEDVESLEAELAHSPWDDLAAVGVNWPVEELSAEERQSEDTEE